MPSEGWDMTNFGLFSGDDDLGGSVAGRLFEATEELKGKTLVPPGWTPTFRDKNLVEGIPVADTPAYCPELIEALSA